MKRNPTPIADRALPYLNSYWADRNERKRDVEAAAHQRKLNATIDATMPDSWQQLAGRKS